MIGFVERTSCPGCDSRTVRTLLDLPFDDPKLSGFVRTYYRIDPAILDAPYVLDRCGRCGLIFQRFVGNDALLEKLYSHWAPTAANASEIAFFTANMASPEASRDGHEMMTLSAFLGRPIRELKVLDYGMGWGLWPAIATRLGADAYGTELSEKMRVEAERNGVKVLAEPLDGEFDFISLEQVIEHVQAPGDLLRRLSRSVRPGGIIKLSLPNATNAPKIITKIITGTYRGDYPTIIPIQPLEHINSFTPRAVRHMAENVGLAVVKPTLAQRYSFIGRSPLSAKELARPVWQYHTRRNIYVWLRLPSR